jgi:hypothetical protein
VIAALILQVSGWAQCMSQTGDIDPARVAAAHPFLVASQVADQLSDGFKRYPPQSDDYAPQFADRLPDEAARRRFHDAFDRIQREVMDKAMARFGGLIDRVALAYARRFTTEELNAGAEFYSSAVGRKLLSSTVTLDDILNGTHSAPEPDRMQTARALVDTLKQTDPLSAALGNTAQFSLPNAGGSAADTTERTNPSPEDDAAARLEKLAAFYARTFTVDELNILIAFYRSPFGQRKGSVDPELQADILNLSAEWFEPFQAELEARLAEAVAKIANE